MLTEQQIADFAGDGFLVVKGLFSAAETAAYRDHYMALRSAGEHPFDMVAQSPRENDPLTQFPRMAHMHRWDPLSRQWLLHPGLIACLGDLLNNEPRAVQSMLYFKPPGARGQALHQDNFYLQVRPGNCCAAWMALDDCDEENGCMQVVAGSHRWPLLCTEEANPDISFTDVSVPLPPGTEPQPVIMAAGDILFFGGNLIHGSLPNRSTTRFRRSLIGHYIENRAEELTEFDQPVLHPDGTERTLRPSPGGAPCGVWDETAKKSGDFVMVPARG